MRALRLLLLIPIAGLGAAIAACTYDWTVGSGSTGGADGSAFSPPPPSNLTCPSGGCDCTSGQTCDRSCLGGSCRLSCATGSDCRLSCGGGGCRVECATGAKCDLSCGGGNCVAVCEKDSRCTTTCLGSGCSAVCRGSCSCTTTAGSCCNAEATGVCE